MSTDYDQHNENDDALDKILAAMRDAAPPQGMEARIIQRLQQHGNAPSAALSRWRDAFACVAPTGEWWRGAITGAATVLLMSAASLFAGHLLQAHRDRMSSTTNSTAGQSVANAPTAVADFSYGAPTSQNEALPCAHLALLRASVVVPSPTSAASRIQTSGEYNATSHPAPPLPLTAQERALVRFAQTASPTQLASLNPEEHAKVEAQDAAAFAKFFAPRAPLPTAEGDAPANSMAAPRSTSEAIPDPLSQ